MNRLGLKRDAEIDGLFLAAGFNQAQAQLVYDLAAERVVPVIAGMAAEYEKKMAQGRSRRISAAPSASPRSRGR